MSKRPTPRPPDSTATEVLAAQLDILPFNGADLQPQPEPKSLEAAVDDWVERAVRDFSLIHRTKEEFFHDVFHEAPWMDAFPFSDESRRFTAFLAQVLAMAARSAPGVRFPSKTEANDWFWFFRRNEQLVARSVPIHLLPKSRGASNALASAAAHVPSPEGKLDAYKAILLKLDEESKRGDGLTVTATSVKAIAGSLGYRKKLPPKPTEYRRRSQVDPDTWHQVVALSARLFELPRSGLTPEKEHSEMLKLTAVLRDLVLRPVDFVFGAFDSDERFVGILVQVTQDGEFYPRGEFVTRNDDACTWKQREGDSKVEYTSTKDWLISEGDRPAGVDEWTTADPQSTLENRLPLVWASTGQPLANGCLGGLGIRIPHLVVPSERDAINIANSATEHLGYTVVPIPDETYRQWREGNVYGQIPLGTALDEVLEPSEPLHLLQVEAADGDDDDKVLPGS